MSSNEIMFVPEEYSSYAKFIRELLNEARLHKIKAEIIGYELCKHTGINYPLYRHVIHPECQPTVCLIAGVHGNEIAGPLSTLHILKDVIHDLPRQYRYVVYPVINPTGFDLRQRFDSDGRDLNAIYYKTLKSQNYCEVQEFYQDVQTFAPFEAVFTLHEDSDRDKFYMYGLGRGNQDYYHAICGFARSLIMVWANAEIEGCQTDEHGLIMANARDYACDARLFTDGLTRVAVTFETPGKLDICFRVNMMVQLVLMSVEMLIAKSRMPIPLEGLPDKDHLGNPGKPKNHGKR